jgi:hypothetical protein
MTPLAGALAPLGSELVAAARQLFLFAPTAAVERAALVVLGEREAFTGPGGVGQAM